MADLCIFLCVQCTRLRGGTDVSAGRGLSGRLYVSAMERAHARRVQYDGALCGSARTGRAKWTLLALPQRVGVGGAILPGRACRGAAQFGMALHGIAYRGLTELRWVW